jgi:DNA gyrase subunit A
MASSKTSKLTKSQQKLIEQLQESVGQRTGIVATDSADWLEENYGEYAISTVASRAIPSVYSGFKPVHARILWTALTSGLTPSAKHKKTASFAGLVLAYHPHGDASVQEAVYTVAQPFRMRVPLVDVKGSVGLHFGDKPAAARYTESRLSDAGLACVVEAKSGACEFKPNYDETTTEPLDLPVKFNNAVVNGTPNSMAVGFAVNTPSHNPDEVLAANLLLLRRPDATVDEVLSVMPGPDFPTGAHVYDKDQAGARDYYTTGKGRFVMRATVSVEPLPRGASKIVVTELPYGVSVGDVLAQINEKSEEQPPKTKKGKPVPAVEAFEKGITSASNKSNKDQRLEIVVHRQWQAGRVLDALWKYTSMEAAFNVNNTFLVDGRPRQLGTIECMRLFLDYRRECVARRTRERVGAIDARLSQLSALLTVIGDVDKAISLIREAKTPGDAQKALTDAFNISDFQASYILSMQLRRLTKADGDQIRAEDKGLRDEKKRLERVLANPDAMNDLIESELVETHKLISSPRLTVLHDADPAEDAAPGTDGDAAVVAGGDLASGDLHVSVLSGGAVVCSTSPWKYPPRTRAYKHGVITSSFTVPADKRTDGGGELLLVCDNGEGVKVPVSFFHDGVPATAKTLGVTLPGNLVGVSVVDGGGDSAYGLIVASEMGVVKRVKADYPLRADTVPVCALADGGRLVSAVHVSEPESAGVDMVFITSAGKVLRADAGKVRAAGCRAGGVAGISVADGDGVIAFNAIPSSQVGDAVVVSLSDAGGGLIREGAWKATSLSEFNVKGRGTGGMAVRVNRKRESDLLFAGVAVGAPEAVAVADGDGGVTVGLPVAASSRSSSGGEFVPVASVPVAVGGV